MANPDTSNDSTQDQTPEWDQVQVKVGDKLYLIRIGLALEVQRKARVILSILAPQGVPCRVMKQALVTTVNTTFFENPDVQAQDVKARATAQASTANGPVDVPVQIEVRAI